MDLPPHPTSVTSLLLLPIHTPLASSSSSSSCSPVIIISADAASNVNVWLLSPGARSSPSPPSAALLCMCQLQLPVPQFDAELVAVIVSGNCSRVNMMVANTGYIYSVCICVLRVSPPNNVISADAALPLGMHSNTQPECHVTLHAAFDNGRVRSYSLRDVMLSATAAVSAAAAAAPTSHLPSIRKFTLGLPLVRQHDAQVHAPP